MNWTDDVLRKLNIDYQEDFDNTCAGVFRPSGYLMKHPIRGRLLIPMANIIRVCDWGKWQFLQNRSRQVLATGIKV